MGTGIYNVLQQVISGGKYVLFVMIDKIDGFYAEGKITAAQRAELTALAETKVDPNYSPMSETEQQFDDRIFVLEAAVMDLGMALGELMMMLSGGAK